MEVQVIAGQVGEDGGVKPDPVNALERQCVGRDFHGGMAAARRQKIGEKAE